MNHLQKYVIIVLALLPSAALPVASGGETGPAAQQAVSNGVYGPDLIWTVELNIPAEEYAAMQPREGSARSPSDQPKNSAREVHRNTFGVDLPWAKGSVCVDNQTFEDVGIRYKGNGTINDTEGTIKKSFKIDFDRFGGKTTFQGLKTLNLNCNVRDPSQFRESLAYGMYHAAGVPASRTAWAEVRLTVPGMYDRELLGVYTIVEQVNKPFLREHFQTDKGLLMKPKGLKDFAYLGDDWDQYKESYGPERKATAREAQRMIEFAKLIDTADDETFRTQIATYLEIDNYLRFLATTAFIANTDSFFTEGHNYYLYLHPQTKKVHFIPWDLDRVLSSVTSVDFTLPCEGRHRLTQRLLAIPEVAVRHRQILQELAAGPFAKERFLRELADLQNSTAQLLDRDAKAAADREELTGGPGADGMFGQPLELETFIAKRTELLQAQLDGKEPVETGVQALGPAGNVLELLQMGVVGLSDLGLLLLAVAVAGIVVATCLCVGGSHRRGLVLRLGLGAGAPLAASAAVASAYRWPKGLYLGHTRT
jgi:hypothetical protein